MRELEVNNFSAIAVQEKITRMKPRWLALALLVAMSGTILAQQPVITPETPVNSAILQQWLHSGDPRLVAWAADFARRTHDAEVIQQMPALLEHWTILPLAATDESEAAQRRAILAVLDALIQENAHVPTSGIQAVAEFFPAQAAILISRLPISESRPTLYTWFGGGVGGWSARPLARIASMMLAKDPEPSFVAIVLAGCEENLTISVIPGGVGPGFGYGSSRGCGGSGPGDLPGWPELYNYYLTEDSSNESSSPLMDLDGDRIAFWRAKQNVYWESCSGSPVEALSPATRHRLVAHWLGVPDKEMSWQPTKQALLVWTNKTAYERELGALIEAERRKLHDTVETLHQRRLLSDNQAETPEPRLVVTIRCDIKPCPLM
jgi:hypothetical protein